MPYAITRRRSLNPKLNPLKSCRDEIAHPRLLTAILTASLERRQMSQAAGTGRLCTHPYSAIIRHALASNTSVPVSLRAVE
jgi:hypothetical protein